MYEYEYTEDGQINIYKIVDDEKTLIHYQPGFETEAKGVDFAEAEIAKREALDAELEELRIKNEARLAEQSEQVEA